MEVGGAKTEWSGDLVCTEVDVEAFLAEDLTSILALGGAARHSRLPKNLIERVASSAAVAAVENKLTAAIKKSAGGLDVHTGGDRGKGQFSAIDNTQQG